MFHLLYFFYYVQLLLFSSFLTFVSFPADCGNDGGGGWHLSREYISSTNIVAVCTPRLLRWLWSTNKNLRQYHGNIKSFLHFLFMCIHILPLYLRKLLPQVFLLKRKKKKSSDVGMREWMRIQTIIQLLRKCLCTTKNRNTASKTSKWNKIIIIVVIISIVLADGAAAVDVTLLAYCTAFHRNKM